MKAIQFLLTAFCTTLILLFISCNKTPEKPVAAETQGTSPSANTTSEKVDWPNWRGTNFDNRVTYSNWDPKAIENPKNKAWKITIGDGYSSPSIKGDKLYIMGVEGDTDGVVYCLDKWTGKEIWRYEYVAVKHLYPGERSTPVILDGKVYVFTQKGEIFCLDAESGKLIFQNSVLELSGNFMPSFGYSGSLRVYENLIIANAGEAGMAFDKNTGALVWTNGPGRAGYSNPTIFKEGDKTRVAMYMEVGLYIVNFDDGKILAFYKWPTYDGTNAGVPIIIGEEILISSSYNMGAAKLLYKNGTLTELWKSKELMVHMSQGVYIDGFLYANHNNANYHWGFFVCMDYKTGKIMWSEDTGVGSVINVNDDLIFLNEKGTVTIVKANPNKYEKVATAKLMKPTCHSLQVFSDGLLFIKNLQGDLLAWDMRKTKP